MEKVIMYEQIYRDMKAAIRDETYRVGDKLPSEKELQEKYKVSRITAKKAMDMLAEEHFITRSPGRGSFVNEHIDEILKADRIHFPLPEQKVGRRRVGVIFDIFDCDFGSNLLRSIEQECRKQNYDMIFRCSYGSVEEETDAVHCALDLGVDGLIIMCAQGEVYNSTILELSLSHFPVVFIDRQIKGIPIPCVKTDNFKASVELTELLIARGHKKICFLTHASINTSTIDERYRGFTSCMVQRKDVVGMFAKVDHYNPTPEDVEKEYKDYNISEFEQVVQENEDCTAYLVAEYKLAVLLERAVENLGVKKEIVGFDGLEPIYNVGHKFIYAKQDEFEMGKRAVDTLNEIVDGKVIQENINIPYEIKETGT